MLTLYCPKCEQHKFWYQFHRGGGGKLNGWCKTCKIEQRHHPKYKEHNRIYSLQYYRDHPEKNILYRERNRDIILAKEREYRITHKYEIIAKVRVRKQREIDTLRKISTKQINKLFAMFNNKCVLCGNTDITVDHVVPLSKGGKHCLTNMIPLCKTCNTKKGVNKAQWLRERIHPTEVGTS